MRFCLLPPVALELWRSPQPVKLGDEAVKGYSDAQEIRGKSQVAVVLVLAEQQSAWKERLAETPSSRVLVQPVTLRELRKVVKRTLGATNNGQEPDEPENEGT